MFCIEKFCLIVCSDLCISRHGCSVEDVATAVWRFVKMVEPRLLLPVMGDNVWNFSLSCAKDDFFWRNFTFTPPGPTFGTTWYASYLRAVACYERCCVSRDPSLDLDCEVSQRFLSVTYIFWSLVSDPACLQSPAALGSAAGLLSLKVQNALYQFCPSRSGLYVPCASRGSCFHM